MELVYETPGLYVVPAPAPPAEQAPAGVPAAARTSSSSILSPDAKPFVPGRAFSGGVSKATASATSGSSENGAGSPTQEA